MLNELITYNKFIKNKYYNIYYQLAKRIIEEDRIYNSAMHENHHILPKSFGGTFSVPYTFREHYIAHLLLTKFTIGRDKSAMTFALHTFFHFDHNRRLGLKFSSVIYEKHKQRFIAECSIRSGGIKNGNADKCIYRFKDSDNNIFNVTRTELNNMNTDLTSHDINALIRIYKKPVCWSSKGWSLYIPDLDIYTDEIPKKINSTMIRTKLCIHCNRLINLGNYGRWHGDKCKLFNTST